MSQCRICLVSRRNICFSVSSRSRSHEEAYCPITGIALVSHPIGLMRRLPQTLSVPGRSSPKPFPVPGRSESWELGAGSWELRVGSCGSWQLGVVGSWLGAGGWELRWELEGTGIWRLGWEVPPCHSCCPATAVATLPSTPCHSALLPCHCCHCRPALLLLCTPAWQTR